MQDNPAGPKDGAASLHGFEADAATLMTELASLTAKLKEVGRGKVDELSKEGAAQLNAQLDALRLKVNTLGTDSEKILASLDKNVRANPYLFIAGALGLGVLLGKARRS